MEPTNMSDKHSDANSVLSSRVHGQHLSVNDEYMPKSIWQSGVVKRLADYIRHVREVDNEPNQRAVSHQPGFTRHVCARNPHRTCNCDTGVCADDSATYRYARGPFLSVRVAAPKPNHLGNFRCPITGQLCSFDVCREWCEGSGTGAATDTDRGDAKTANHR
jgi:hypothetical protein